MHYDTVWSFETAQFRVTLDVTPCQDDPADSFQFQEDIDAVRDGTVEWFDAIVRVYFRGRELGADSLCCCAYNTVREFYTSHRDPDPMNRNCSLMRAKRGKVTTICHYFPDMVSIAIKEARRELTKCRDVKLRRSALLQAVLQPTWSTQ